MAEQADLIRKICDKRSLDALGILRSVNKEKCKVVESRLLSFYERKRMPIDFESYLELVRDIDQEQNISFQRRKDCYGLDEITDI